VPGRVSTETDARFSFDTEGSIAKGQQLIRLYEERKVRANACLIKIASTWEGIKGRAAAEGKGSGEFDVDVFVAASGAVREAKVQLYPHHLVGRINPFQVDAILINTRSRGTFRSS